MSAIRDFITRFTPLRQQDWETIAPFWEPMVVAKGEHLLQPGQVCRDLYFLEDGLIRFFFMHEGEERTRYFLQEHYVFTEQNSFRLEKPSTEGIMALTTARVWRMRRADAYALLGMPAWSTFVRALLQELQALTEAQMTEMLTQTAEQRYRRMMEEEPELLRVVPLQHLASYLNIAPPSLSRIRKKFASEQRTSPR
jgi:CRP-like cAMP-binding protein